MSADQDDLSRLLTLDTPLIDVRAPVEYVKGALPTASNLPILNDDERQQIGICYKQRGPAEALALGYQLVSGDTRTARIQGWIDFLERHPAAHLYCFRGGQRSGIACEWLRSSGWDVPRIDGGYKRLRQHLLAVYASLPALVIVSGRTGTGKTQFLKKFAQSIDLEGIANHRGSAFGGLLSPQPSQVDFENALAIAFLKHDRDTEVLLEDEGRLIGRIHVPLPLQDAMKQCPIVVIEESLEARTDRIHQEYIVEQWQAYQAHFGPEAETQYRQYLLSAIDAIRKRLGGARHAEIRRLMTTALSEQSRGQLESHRAWISALLSDYYDPMYEYQLSQKSERVRYRGPRHEVIKWYQANQGGLS